MFVGNKSRFVLLITLFLCSTNQIAQTRSVQIELKRGCGECMPGVDPPPPPPFPPLEAASGLGVKPNQARTEFDSHFQTKDFKAFEKDLRSKHFSGARK
jgi:hypothetical protein